MTWQRLCPAGRRKWWRSLPGIIEGDFGVVEVLASFGVSDRTAEPSLPQRAGAEHCGAYCFVFFGFFLATCTWHLTAA
eukprot:8915872-Prorocentrum_lima.AAC.1